MSLFKATIEVLVDVDREDEACDCIAETFRELLREFAPGSPLIDWRYAGADGDPAPYDADGFEYVRRSDRPARQPGGKPHVPAE